MDKKELYILVRRYRKGTIDADSLARLNLFLETEEGRRLLEETWDDELEPAYYIGDDLVRSRVFQKIANDSRIIPELTTGRSAIRTKWYRISAAAALLLIGAVCAVWWYSNEETAKNRLAMQETETIMPGSNRARIQFEDGSFIELDEIMSDTVLADRGLRIFKRADGSISYAYDDNKAVQRELYNTIVTPRGGEYSLTLPDGSKVWLNAATKLRYPLQFEDDNRTIELDGEAYFEIVKQKNENHAVPFYVVSGNQKVEVLGTQFNVNTYGAMYKTTLVEGSVAMHYKGLSGNHTLKPSQQAVFSVQTGTSTVQYVDPSYSIAWRSGKFAFDNVSIYEVMEEIARWYDIEVSFDGDMSTVRYSGSISRFEKFEQLLQLIEWTDLVTFKVDGRRITVMK
ncbi:FecR family protein [Sphingobacterium faecale]|uniref:FecR domain-containing protein n=1 Tax=Sphingobacterium faecale TaxID=2803775 RepID=A0ABS1RB11_9SPHI|nr:FecR family protein [Sphingobacterium faecale]MBL1411026.1 FecR domain-containing protein [Sphingobacterium faecale]